MRCYASYQSVIAVLLPFWATTRLASQIAPESFMIAGWQINPAMMSSTIPARYFV
jgi:hypothetical protein